MLDARVVIVVLMRFMEAIVTMQKRLSILLQVNDLSVKKLPEKQLISILLVVEW